MNQPICKNLRTKKMYIPAQADEVRVEPADAAVSGSCHCWCNLTLTEVGADDEPVHFELCVPGRKCFAE